MAWMRTCVCGWTRAFAFAVAVALAAAVALAGCEGGSGENASPCGRVMAPSRDGLASGRVPVVEVWPTLPDGGYVFDVDDAAPGGVADAAFELLETGGAVLAVTGLRWEYEPLDPAAEADGPALTCTWGPDELPCDALSFDRPVCVSAVGVARADGQIPSLPFRVRYRRVDDGPRQARLTVQSDSRGGDLELTFRVEPLEPRVSASPERVTFQGGQRGETLRRYVSVLSTGTDELVFDDMEVVGDPELAAEVDGLALPCTLGPNQSAQVEVTLRRDSPAARAGTLRVHTNDPTAPWTEIDLVAEPVARRLEVAPESLAFETVSGGEDRRGLVLRAAADEPVHLSAVRLNAADRGWFHLEPPLGPGTTVSPLEARAVEVVYTPGRRAPGGPPDEATLDIESDGWEPLVTVPLTGQVVASCPQPVVVVEEGATVRPQTNLHLQGDQSYAAGSDVRTWLWSVVERPEGDRSAFVPSWTFPNPTFEANLGGSYRFCLEVWDEDDVPSCEPACVDVEVVPTHALHVELLWHTPADPDESDTGPFAGADVDLHVAHPLAPADPAAPDRDDEPGPDPWFDPRYDCWWANPRADWGSPDKPDGGDASLDRDDTDGAGPETVNIEAPEDGALYRIAAYYNADHEFGTSDATVRIWIRGALAWEGSAQGLVREDLWRVATVAWPDGVVTPCAGEDGGPCVTPGYPAPPPRPPAR